MDVFTIVFLIFMIVFFIVFVLPLGVILFLDLFIYPHQLLRFSSSDISLNERTELNGNSDKSNS